MNKDLGDDFQPVLLEWTDESFKNLTTEELQSAHESIGSELNHARNMPSARMVWQGRLERIQRELERRKS